MEEVGTRVPGVGTYPGVINNIIIIIINNTDTKYIINNNTDTRTCQAYRVVP